MYSEWSITTRHLPLSAGTTMIVLSLFKFRSARCSDLERLLVGIFASLRVSAISARRAAAWPLLDTCLHACSVATMKSLYGMCVGVMANPAPLLRISSK